ncbi:DUF2987 domain-containing protein [Oceanisphaera arctica]|uniref:DUF2987 domain-containing protein n=1 Tax=Oceanisphaera arctica TaxID=641510 RepID=A0A2P5TQL8_9GAMM|nr:DUF2987 domain-containing protein [Oceanisphaera arctica]PPL18015.1 hypothetical protein UN63_02275 [Oceanisphaera arctica]GHA09223.1 hypothetical protein GCM10007082_07520 [Oceanisphaera arctica]
MRLSFIITMLALTTTPAQATPFNLGYSGFYKYMSKVEKAKVEHAELGFYLSRTDEQGLCSIESGIIRVDDTLKGEVEVLPHGQFLLPYDKQLDLDKALVELEVTDTEQCDISIQIQANLVAGDVSMAQLRQAEDEMYRLLQKMAGWPGRYFVPELKGIKLHPAKPGQTLNGVEQLKLSDADLADERTLSLPAVRITPWF